MPVFNIFTKEKKRQQEMLSIAKLSYKNERRKFLELEKKYHISDSENDIVGCLVSTINLMVDDLRLALRAKLSLEEEATLYRSSASTISKANSFMNKFLVFKKIGKREFEEAKAIEDAAFYKASEFSKLFANASSVKTL
ncbi:hypothetical protein IKG33_01945 [Candidatus Saccharibacteria bacterium]|nr:hypothetical protein [Candidatus Saccharibacteria bacterium]